MGTDGWLSFWPRLFERARQSDKTIRLTQNLVPRTRGDEGAGWPLSRAPCSRVGLPQELARKRSPGSLCKQMRREIGYVPNPCPNARITADGGKRRSVASG